MNAHQRRIAKRKLLARAKVLGVTPTTARAAVAHRR